MEDLSLYRDRMNLGSIPNPNSSPENPSGLEHFSMSEEYQLMDRSLFHWMKNVLRVVGGRDLIQTYQPFEHKQFTHE